MQPRPAGPFLSLCLWVSLSLSLSPSPSLLCLPIVSALPLPVSSPPPTPGQPVGCPEAAVAAAEWAPCSRPHPPLGVTPGQALAACCLKGPASRGKGEERDCLRSQATHPRKMELMCMVGQEDTILRHPQIHVVRGVDPEACLPGGGDSACLVGLGFDLGHIPSFYALVSPSVSGALCAHPQGFWGRWNSTWAKIQYSQHSSCAYCAIIQHLPPGHLMSGHSPTMWTGQFSVFLHASVSSNVE